MSGYHELSKNIQSQIQVCQKAYEYFGSQPHFPVSAKNIFGQKLLFCYMQLKQFENALKIADNMKTAYISGSYNWFMLHIYLFLLYFHSRNYQKASTVYFLVVSNKKFSQISSTMEEFWKIAKPYIFFLYKCNLISLGDRESSFKKFRIYKFLNDVPMYSKDKRGFNISILIAHVLLLIAAKKYDQIIDRVEALNQYCYRYLRRDETFRSNCFIKMLLQLPKAGFHNLRVHRYAKKYHEKLLSVPLEMSKQPTEIELIPYEDLWELVLELLEKNRKK